MKCSSENRGTKRTASELFRIPPATLLLAVLFTGLCSPAFAFVPSVSPGGVGAPDFISGEWRATATLDVRGGFDISGITPPETAPAQQQPAVQPAPQQATAPPQIPLEQPQQPPPQQQQPGKPKADIEIKGYRYVRIRNYGSSGNSFRFLSQEGLFSRGQKLEQGTDLTVAAKPGRVSLKGSFLELPMQDREMQFEFGLSRYTARLGDLNVDFRGGTFSPFSKKITGVEFGYQTNNTNFQLISSKSKSQTRTESFSGRNIKGPYDLAANDLIPDRVEVRLNGVPLSKDRYILNAFIGEITFYEIIGPDDVVTITYEQRLRGSLNAGNIIGFSGGWTNGKLTAGFSRLVQQSNAEAAQSVLRTVTGETATLSGEYLQVANKFIARSHDSGSETITMSRDGLVTTLIPGEDYNSTSDAALTFAVKMENYRLGRFKLAPHAISATATYKVSYSYFSEEDGTMQFQYKEMLSPIAGLATLQRQTVYYGSEKVYVCDDRTLDFCPTTLIPGTDYEIDEALNRITFLRYQDEPWLRIDYWYYPAPADQSTSYDHTVHDFNFRFQPRDGLALEAEFAMSESDVSGKPIQVLNERLKVTTDPIACTSSANADQCEFTLAHGNIVARSVSIYFNDRIAQTNILSEYSQFTVAMASGKVSIKMDIPAGTIIYADYRYMPGLAPGLATGNINRFAGEFKDKTGKTHAAFSLKTGDTYFTPIGSETNMETRALSWNISRKLSPTLEFAADNLSIDTAADIEETHKTTSESRNYKLGFKPQGKLKLKLDTAWSTRDISDDYSPSTTDTSEKTFDLKADGSVPGLKGAEFNFSTAKKKNNNNVDGGGTDTTQRNLGFSWKPMPKLSLSASQGESRLAVNNVATTYSTKNVTRTMNASYLALDLVTIGINFDRQTSTDSRPDVSGDTVNQNILRLETKPIGKIKFISYVKTQNDRPSVNTPSTKTDNSSLSTSIFLTKAISISPMFTRSKSTYGTLSGSKSSNDSLEFEYRPVGKKYHFTWGTEKGTRSSVGSTSSSSFKIKRDRYEAVWNPSQIWAISTNLESEKDTSSAGPEDNFTMDVFNVKLRHNPNKRRSHWALLTRTSRGGTQSNDYSVLELGLDWRLSDLFRWDLRMRNSGYTDGAHDENSYNGSLIESSLRIEF